jgi:uncharacterized protein
VARENGLEPLAKIIMAQNKEDIDFLATKYLNDNVNNEDAALQGARDYCRMDQRKYFCS